MVREPKSVPLPVTSAVMLKHCGESGNGWAHTLDGLGDAGACQVSSLEPLACAPQGFGIGLDTQGTHTNVSMTESAFAGVGANAHRRTIATNTTVRYLFIAVLSPSEADA